MIEYPWPNLPTMFFSEAQKRQTKPFLWSKINGEYHSITWHEVAIKICSLARALSDQGIKSGDRIVLLSENRPEWLIADLAIMSIGAITVPAYITNSIEDHIHILKDSEAIAGIASTKKHLQNLYLANKKVNKIKMLISIENGEKLEQKEFKSWNTLLNTHNSEGLNDVQKLAQSWKSDEIACLIYTSGTGGRPKGVMLSHRNLLHNIRGANGILKDLGLSNNIFLSFLPLSHSYEHMAGQFVPISIGAQIYYAEGIEMLATNMLEAQPTIMTAVPRLYETMYQKIKLGIRQNNKLKEMLFNKTIDLGKKRYESKRDLGFWNIIMDKILDKLVRDKVRNRFGGQLKAMVSGGAPLNPKIGIFFSALGVPILQGYGQTETAPLISANLPSNPRMDTVGPPVEGTEVKIAEDGEILVRGDLIMKGYWNNKKETSKVIRDGWIHTGDIGAFVENGHLKITDRKKDIIVNSGGDNISPQKIEGLLTIQEEIMQAAVFGDKQSYLVALIVPDETWSKSQTKDIRLTIKAVVDRVNKSLSTIEKIKRFTIISSPFSIENEQMTPTMKVRRHIVRDKYEAQLNKMYP